MLEIFKTLARSVFGMNHVANHENQYLEIVGNGLDAEHPRNARTLDIAGNEVLAGRLTVGAQPEGDNDVATKKYVDDNASGGGAYNVTVAYDGSAGEEGGFVFNKTWQEIHDAFAGGKTILISYEDTREGSEASGITAIESVFHNTGENLTEGYGLNFGGGMSALTETANGYPVADYI